MFIFSYNYTETYSYIYIDTYIQIDMCKFISKYYVFQIKNPKNWKEKEFLEFR